MDHPTRIEHLVTLKVMRLTRPTLATPIVVTTDSKDISGNLFNDALKRDITTVPGTETINATSFLLLPQSFGSIYLGEMFSCYICVSNVCDHTVKDVTFRATLQEANKTISLSLEAPNSADLSPGDSMDEVIHHEMKKIGHHILVCEVGYCSGTLTSERQMFRKYFKFEVYQPLDVKTKVFAFGPNDVYFEAKVQNKTSANLVLERMSFESAPEFNVEKYNTIRKVDGLQLNIMAPNEKKQFLYHLNPNWRRIPDLKTLFDATNIGKLDIVWRSSMGEKGRLQTPKLDRKRQEQSDLHLSVKDISGIVFANEKTSVIFQIVNLTDRCMEMQVILEPVKDYAWIGKSGGSLGNVGPGESRQFTLNLVPLNFGLVNISGIRLLDQFQGKTYDFDEIAQIFVMRKGPESNCGHKKQIAITS